MKKCPFCDADIEDSARFCLYCMQPLTEKEQILLRRKKKVPWLIIVAAVVAVLWMLTFFLLRRLPEDSSEPHSHNYIVRNTSREYLQAEATCAYPASYYYSCSCGEKGSTTFNWGKAKAHTFVTIPGHPASCVTPGSTEGVLCSDCGFASKISSTLSALGHTFVLGDSPAVCLTCGENATITINYPEFPCFLNDSIRIDGGTCLFQPSGDGSWSVRLKLTCTNVSDDQKTFLLAFVLGDSMSTYGFGSLAPDESGVISATNQVADPSGIYDLVFVEG